MSYQTGPIQNATQPSKDLMDTVGAVIDAHAAWEFVEEVVGTGTNISRVYRCLGTLNGFGSDFYAALTRTSLTSGVVVVMGEGYDAVNKKLIKPAVYFTTTPTAPAADLSYPVDRHVANETTLTAATQGFLHGAGANVSNTFTGLGVNTTGFTYWVHVGSNYVVVATRVGSTGTVAYAGLYDSFHTTTVDPFPIWCGGFVSTGTAFQAVGGIVGAYTRQSVAGALNYQFTGGMDNAGWTRIATANALSPVTREAISNNWFPTRLLLHENSRRNAMRGLLKPAVLAIDMAENPELMGDTVSVSGQLYTCLATAPLLTPSTTSIWVSQA